MRKDNILTFALLCVFHDWTFSVDSTAVNPHRHRRDPYGTDQTVQLSIVHDSVDDMYSSCTQKTLEKLNTYLSSETNIEGIFKRAWSKAESCAEDVENRFKKDNSEYNSAELAHDHIKAICAYSAGEPKIHDEFNKAVLSEKDKYKTSFQFHSLHFLLTDALRLLKKQQGCHNTFRRTKNHFKGEVNKEIRFGFFASSSTHMGQSTFGDKSCFEIETCFGADLKSYPKMGNREKEVLIPPYEVFKVTDVLKKENNQNLWCDVVYKLKSIKTLSNLNCEMFKTISNEEN
uniref:NAD(P)(+)--arginine ADP-ribosyltransferase n=1 Tax=Salmo salar TaxID=8030 RepID=B5XBZ1_SALSA|nr:Ecto-ADP-ribosyltransferase 4 precursor [Salmo salar]ADM16176.1 Ecto-ADP-ribosyltransferase 4 precursor [Salmo salar]